MLDLSQVLKDCNFPLSSRLVVRICPCFESVFHSFPFMTEMLKSSAGEQHKIETGCTETSTTTYNSRILGYEQKRQVRHDQLTIFVGGIPTDMTPSDIMHHFVKFTFDSGCRGSVLNVQIIPKKGFGFVTFDYPDAVECVLQSR